MYFWMLLVVGFTVNLDHYEVQARDSECSTIATYNAGLMKVVGEYYSRKTRTPGALLHNDADFYCLQEYWLEKDMENLLSQLSPIYPHHYSAIHHTVDQLKSPEGHASSSQRTSGCTLTDMAYFGTVIFQCIVAQGCDVQFNISANLGMLCAMSNCSAELSSTDLHPDCIQCLLQFKASPTYIPEECTPGPGKPQNRLNPSGVVMVSKKPLTGVRYSKFHNEDLVVGRGYLEAKVKGVGKVVCTHLTSIFPVFFEYNVSAYNNYDDMQRFEISHLISRYASVDHIMMADFNTGPAVASTGVVGEFASNYEKFVAAGYMDPFVGLGPGNCTFCQENVLVDHFGSTLLDHILVKGNHLAMAQPQRIFDDADQDIPLSDHFGVQVRVCPTGSD